MWSDRFQFEYARYNIMKETIMFIYVMSFCEHVSPHYLPSYIFFSTPASCFFSFFFFFFFFLWSNQSVINLNQSVINLELIFEKNSYFLFICTVIYRAFKFIYHNPSSSVNYVFFSKPDSHVNTGLAMV